MKNATPSPKSPALRKLAAAALLAAFGATSALADIVYVTSTCSNAASTTVCGSPINPDINPIGLPVYSDSASGFTSAVSTKPDGPITPGGRYFGTGFASTTPDIEGVTVRPWLGVPGGVYRVYHIYSSAAANINTNLVVGVTNVENCTLSFNQTDKFQTQYGVAVAGKHVYQFLGYLTNDPGMVSPVLRFYYVSGFVDAGAQRRLVVDTFKFALDDPCLDVPVVGVTGPLATNLDTVVVTGVSDTATKITVYQDSGSGFAEIGSLTSGIVGGNNSVPVTGLVLGAKVTATQTLLGVEGCPPTAGSGTIVGGGANPSVRLCYSIRETSSTGPVGEPGINTSANIHFLGALTLYGLAPTDSLIIYPSNDWQTVTISAGRETVGDSANAAGAVVTPPGANGYAGTTTVLLQVYAYKTTNSVTIFSRTAAQAAGVTSNDLFNVNWSWDAVAGAEGYRLLRDYTGFGYTDYVDVPGATTYSDDSVTGWAWGNTVTPTMVQTGPSVQWNGTVTTPNVIGTQWGILEALAFSIADTTDTGPYDIYVDNIQNGATVFQTFETAPAGTTDYGFRAPSFSGTTGGNILAAPNAGSVVNNVSDTGTKSFRIRYQWQVTTTNKWLRLTTSGVNNPQVNLDDPISIRLLMQPKGAPLPTPPPAPTLTANLVAGRTVLNWTGGHRLQSSVDVPGTYTNVPQVLSPNTWTNITRGAFLSPWTNNFTEATRFFRLVD